MIELQTNVMKNWK